MDQTENESGKEPKEATHHEEASPTQTSSTAETESESHEEGSAALEGAVNESLNHDLQDLPEEFEIMDESEAKERARRPSIKELALSPDLPSRFGIFMSISFAILSIICLGALSYVLIQSKRAHTDADSVATEKVLIEPSFHQPLGHFQVFLKKVNETERDPEARVDVVAECSTTTACEDLKKKISEARDLINPILSSVTVSEMMDQEAKDKLRKRIADQLNGLTEQGKVLRVDFTDLTIENGK